MRQALWIIALAIIGGIAAAAQLDRQSRYAAPVANIVPQPLRSFAQYHQAASMIDAQNAKGAIAEAKLLVARRPMPAENLILLAQAQMVDGDRENGAISAQSAAKRGWRDDASQRAMLAAALASGDNVQAVRRYVAIWITQGPDEDIGEIAPQVFASPAAQAELTRLLSAKSRWRERFLRDGMDDLPLAPRGDGDRSIGDGSPGSQ